jgi:hypothetical protein
MVLLYEASYPGSSQLRAAVMGDRATAYVLQKHGVIR